MFAVFLVLLLQVGAVMPGGNNCNAFRKNYEKAINKTMPVIEECNEQDCPAEDGFIYSEAPVSLCYRLDFDLGVAGAAYDDAADACEADGGRLVVADTLDKYTALTDLLPLGAAFWLGGTGTPSNSEADWSNGQPITTVIFPCQFPGECLTYVNRNYVLCDCSLPLTYLCEYPLE